MQMNKKVMLPVSLISTLVCLVFLHNYSYTIATCVTVLLEYQTWLLYIRVTALLEYIETIGKLFCRVIVLFLLS